MCYANMKPLSLSERLDRVLKALRTNNVRRDAAMAFTALSEGETGYQWLLERPPNTNEIPPWCCGVPIGIEPGAKFTPALAASPLTLQFLKSKNWLQLDGTDTTKLKPANGFGNPNNQEMNQEAFEYTVSVREKAALAIYSVGPFQLNQALFGTACGFPTSWEELWDLYTAGSQLTEPADVTQRSGVERETWVADARITYLLLKWGRYNIPKSYVNDGCRNAQVKFPDGTRDTDLTWLDGHAGNRTVSTWAYDGNAEKLGSRRPYSQVWQEVKQRAITLYPDWL